MVLGTEEAILVADHLQFAIGIQVSVEGGEGEQLMLAMITSRQSSHSLVIARVQRITSALLGPEFQSEERILAPRDIGIHMNLILRFG